MSHILLPWRYYFYVAFREVLQRIDM